MRTGRKWPIALAILALTVMAMGACGDDSDDPADNGGNGGDDTGTAAQTLTVTATDFEFDQNAITLEPGDVEVTFVNDGDVEHSFTSTGTGGLGFDVEAEPGEEASTTFTLPDGDTFPFFCRYHPDAMRGAIHVGEEPGAGSTDDSGDKTGGGGADY